MADRMYCSIADVLSDLGRRGVRDEAQLLGFIRSASTWIERKLGVYLPEVASKTFNGEGGRDLWVPPLLELTSVIVDGNTISSSQYQLFGDGVGRPVWENGPCSRITILDDATELGAWSYEDEGNVLTGKWGLYLESKSLGISVTLADGSSTDLSVSNGSLVSPGMVLLVETEQLLVEGTGDPTAATSLVNGAIDQDADIVTVDNGSEFYAGEVIQIDLEDMAIVKKNGNSLYVLRGWNETVIAAHNDDSAINVYRTYTIKRGVNGTSAVAHADKAVNQYLPPWDVRYLCKQTAILMLKKSESGYAGKTGNADLGEVYYHNEFPKSVYQEIEKNYKRRLAYL